ncbi:ER protein Pkr1-domain-containing protein [Bisporella sp. PMI_857]|nr:ER protein Pkr1-domain-containing protein [Bisporella sp. PMI_857]
MSAFITDLFQSIFTPGPTSSLLIATNVAFAGLQVVLAFLLVATYSIHFAILSFLCAGLWWAINWFVAELKLQQKLEEEKKRLQIQGQQDDDTETEAETIIAGQAGNKVAEVFEPKGELKDRGAPHSEISTEDEWEKVSDNNEADKDR